MTEQTSPSRRAGLRDEIAEALEAADYRMDMRRGDLADSVMPVLYRAWPWLCAEAEEATVPPEPATDQTALRDRIAEALYRHDWPVKQLWPQDLGNRGQYELMADVVLAVLPAPVGRAAVLREAADAAAEQLQRNPWTTAADVIDELRRMAAESPSAVVVRRATDETPGEAGRTVAYQSNGGSLLRCIAHAPEWATILCGDFHPVTSDDLPDGGLCTMPDCGVDVLIPQQPKENRP